MNIQGIAPRDDDCTLPTSSEGKLLVACASTVTRLAEVRELIGSGLDWQWILSHAIDYGIAPLLYFHLKNSAEDGNIPSDIKRKLQSRFRQSHVEGINRRIKLKEILLAFASEGISIILLKGAALEALVYKSAGLRPMLDLDLMVMKTDLRAAAAVLRRLGYIPDESYRPEEWYRSHHHHLAPYRSADGTILVELHHHIVFPNAAMKIPATDFWREARQVQVGSVPALVLAPEHLLLTVCIHLSHGACFERSLRSLIDIAEILRVYGEQINWNQLVSDAARYEVARSLYYALWLASSITRVNVPLDILQSLRSEARISWAQDTCLKSLIPRVVFPDFTRLPSWLIRDVIAGLVCPTRRGGLARIFATRLRERFGMAAG